VLTLLSARLLLEQMKDDFYLTWKPLSPYRGVYVMREAARQYAWRLGAGAFLVLSIICAVRYRRRYEGGPAAWKRFVAAAGISLGILGAIVGVCFTLDHPATGVLVLICSVFVLIVSLARDAAYRRQKLQLQFSDPALSRPVVLTVLLVPILLGSCVYLALPKAPDAELIPLSRFASAFTRWDHEEVLKTLHETERGGHPAELLAACRKDAASMFTKWGPGARPLNNPLTGRPCREEDSPGNYVIELKDGKPTYFYFDENGKKIELGAIGRDN
jgi:hypothetical protein